MKKLMLLVALILCFTISTLVIFGCGEKKAEQEQPAQEQQMEQPTEEAPVDTTVEEAPVDTTAVE